MKRVSFTLFAFALALLGARPSPAAPAQPAARLVATPGSIAFARPGETATVTLTNAGAAPAAIGAISVLQTGGESSDFYVEPIPPRALAPGESITLRTSWQPSPRQPRSRQAFGALLASDGTTPPRPLASVALRASVDPPLLSWLVFCPLLGIPLVLLVPRGRERLTRWIALAASAVPVALAAAIAARFDASASDPQLVEHVVWIRSFGVEYFVGVDGVSISMILLTAIVSVIAVGASWSIPVERHARGYFALFLLLEVGMMGVFCALDFFLFYVFWELMLLPMYFLIGIWGGPRREYAAIKFFLYTLAGSVLMLLALIALHGASGPGYLVDGTPAAHTFDLVKLAASARSFATAPPILGFAFGKLVWVLLFLAFAVKVPVVPLHTWLPDAHVEAPTAISVILAGVLLKMGPYGLLRVCWPILPEATRWAAHAMALLGAVSIVWGALCAMAQKDLKRLVAYSSVSHMGYCLLGMASLSAYGTTGALVQMFNHGTITSMLFLLVGVLYDRTHTRELDAFGGLAQVLPHQAAMFGLAFMASLGLPGLSGFIGEALVFLGAFGVHRVATVVAGVALVLTAAYHLTAIQKVQLGALPERWRGLAGNDLTPREWLTLLPLAALVVVLGWYPSPLLSLVAGGVRDVLLAAAGAAAP